MKWYKVFDSEEKAFEVITPNHAILLRLGERKICLSNYNRHIYATADRCPHNGESLSKGRVNYLGEIICPWHNYRYQVKDGSECMNRTQDVETYPVEHRSDGVFIGVS